MYTSWRHARWAVAPLAAVLVACGGQGGGDDPTPPRLSNAAPLIAGSPAVAVVVGSSYSFLPAAGDNEGDALVFGIEAKPPWASFNATTGQLSGTPAVGDAGVYAGIVVWVSDGGSRTALAAFDLTVSVPSKNREPQLGGTPPAFAVAGHGYSFTPAANDPDGTPLAFAIRNRPSWASFDGATGRLEGTPPLASSGTFADIMIAATDGEATVWLPAFTIVVAPPINRPPAIFGTPPRSVEEGRFYDFTPTANDADAGDALSFMVQNEPAWASFDASSGRLFGTPPAPGSFANIIVTVDDGQANASLPSFTIDVTALTANHTPVIGGNPPTDALTGSQYSFKPAASDADNDALIFTIANRPRWATFDESTGLLQGAPATVDAGTHDNIVISVTDGTASASLAAFSIVVSKPPNQPPAISGVPATSVTVGTPYSFTPVASDPDDGDTLAFTIQNRPTWAAFDAGTGTLQGMPTITEVGTTSGIVISVRDADNASAALAAFSITVESNERGSALLSWLPPTQNTDGSPLTNLAGYKVYWGTSPGVYVNSVTLKQGGLASYLVESLTPNSYYFAITAMTTAGTESQYSNVATKTIQ